MSISVPPYVCDPEARTIKTVFGSARVTPTQFAVFTSIAGNAPRYKNWARIANDVWGAERQGVNDWRHIKVLISDLRKQVRRAGIEIESSFPRGYRLAAFPMSWRAA